MTTVIYSENAGKEDIPSKGLTCHHLQRQPTTQGSSTLKLCITKQKHVVHAKKQHTQLLET